MKLQIDINQHSVSIEGHTVFRPSGISVMQWLDTWETMKASVPDADSDTLRRQLDDVTSERDELQRKVERIEGSLNMIDSLKYEIAELKQQIKEQEKELLTLRREKLEWAMDIKA